MITCVAKAKRPFRRLHTHQPMWSIATSGRAVSHPEMHVDPRKFDSFKRDRKSSEEYAQKQPGHTAYSKVYTDLGSNEGIGDKGGDRFCKCSKIERSQCG
eukprot:869380-Prorocentrum_minimum.AAC.4